MDLGLAFDDEDLDTARDKNRDDTFASYSVKTCTSQWFESTVEANKNGFLMELNPEQIPHLFKFSGDFHYHHKNYEKARERYTHALDLLPDSNVSVRQDVTESLCRCYLYCGQTDESLQMARDFVSEMSNEDDAHQRQALILLSFVCEKTRRWAECVDCLEKLCSKQMSFAQCWDQLGDAYMELFINPSAGEDNCKKGDTLEGDNLVSDAYLVKPLTCYIRASLLFQAVMGTASNLIKSRNEAWLMKISKKVNSLPFSDTVKAFAFQCIQEEIENQALSLEDKSEDSKSAPWSESSRAVANLSHSQAFYNKFCSWYLKSQI